MAGKDKLGKGKPGKGKPRREVDRMRPASEAEDPAAQAPALVHAPVLLEEVLAWLDPAPGEVAVDGTVGMGGHAVAVAAHLGPAGHLIGLDRDDQALALAQTKLADCAPRIDLLRGDYADMPQLLSEIGIAAVDCILLDIGVSSLQLDAATRGFSFRYDAPLDMRMDRRAPRTAADWLNEESEARLEAIFREYGEERQARRIAKTIVDRRRDKTIETTGDLVDAVCSVVPRRGRIHPATRIFQALRIAVNDELGQLERGVQAAMELLRDGGRLVVITFHSLEARLLKRLLQEAATRGEGWLPRRKVVKPSAAECMANPRARSATLRVFQKGAKPPRAKGRAVRVEARAQRGEDEPEA